MAKTSIATDKGVPPAKQPVDAHFAGRGPTPPRCEASRPPLQPPPIDASACDSKPQNAESNQTTSGRKTNPTERQDPRDQPNCTQEVADEKPTQPKAPIPSSSPVAAAA